MISRGCFQISLVVLVLTYMTGLALLSPPVPAYGSLVPPTPTNEPRAGGKPDRSEPLGQPSATVSGFVYNYSEAAYQPGITVVLSGGGWRAETVTDSNGYYQFGNLGFGSAVLNLQLPPGGHSVTQDWPVILESGVHVKVNLGYYMWDAPPPIPVILSGTLSNNTLIVKVENNTTEVATGGQLEIVLPEPLSRAQTPVVSQGTLQTTEDRIQVAVGDLSADHELLVNLPLMRKATSPVAQATESIQVAFTYDQQITPQRLLIASASVTTQPALPAPAQAGLATPGVAAAGAAAARQATPPPAGPVAAQEEPSVTIAEEPAAVPITGGAGEATSVVTILLPALLVIGLGVAGWRALRPRL